MKKLWGKIWWYFNTGTTIVVKWPTMQTVEVGPGHRQWRQWYDGDSRVAYETDDPNDCYRPWLEENVGVQDRDWGWSAHSLLGTLQIVFRKGKEEQATMAAMKWG